jgi:type I restriction enzyme S subunit
MLVPRQQQKRIPPTWQSVPLGYLTMIVGGSTPSKDTPEYWGGEFPWVSPKDMKVPVIHDSQDHVTTRALQETAIQMVQPPAVLIVVRGMILAHSFPTALIARPVTINQDMKALLPSRRVEDRFLRYALDAHADVLLSVVEESGHGTRCLRSDLWTKVELPTPPLHTQRAIADFLDRKTRAIDELIRKKERLIELLQEKRQALITQAVTKGLDPNVPMKGAGVRWLGKIPAKRLFQEIDRRLGQAEPPPLLSVSIHHGVRERSDLTDRESRADIFVRYKLCEAGDIVINRMRAFQGAIGISPMRGIVSPDYAVLRMNASVSARFFHHLFRSSWLVGEITARLRGIGSSELGNVRTPRINIQDLGEIRLDLPPLSEQRAIADFLDVRTQSINELIGKNARLIDRLREYRQALISAAVTGQIDVTERVAA